MLTRFSAGSLFTFLMFSLFFTSCQKDELHEPSIGSRDAFSFSYSANQVSPGDSVTVTFDIGNGADCGHVQVQMTGAGGGWSQVVNHEVPDSGVVTFVVVPDAPGDYGFRAKYTRTGKPSSCPFESTGWVDAEELLEVLGDEDDEEEQDSLACESYFSGEAISCDSAREAVFTFVSAEDLDYVKIQGGLTNFTLDSAAVVTVTGADFDVRQRTPGHSSNLIITLEGSVTACDTVTINVQWNSSNQGAYITGDWSASAGDDDLVVEALECE